MAAVALPSYQGYQKRARSAEAKSALGNLLVAQQAYSAEHGKYTADLVAAGFDFKPDEYKVIGFDGTAGTNFFRVAGDSTTTPGDACVYSTGTPGTFMAGAFGDTSKIENWQVDEDREFKNLKTATDCS